MATLTNVISNATGNVGIGTISPTRKLDVNGDGYFASTLYIADNTALNLGNTSQIYHNSARASTQFTGTSGANTMCIKDSDGNVGIGTTGPVAKLHVSGSGQTVIRVEASTTTNVAVFAAKADTDAVLIMGMYGGSGVGNQFGVSAARQAFIGTTSYSTVHPTSLVIGNVSNIPIAFGIDNTERMRITSDGNVGIGTTSPASKLYVVSSGGPIARFDGSSVASSGATEIDVLGPQSNGDLNLGIGGSTLTDATNNIQNKAFVTAGTGLSGLNLRSDVGYVQITTGGLTSANERMRIAADGNVGIGTTSPTQLLEVYGTSPMIRVLAMSGSSTLRLTDNGVRNWDLKVVDVNDYFEVGGTNVTSLVVTGGGNVGIGTTSPSDKLHVYGGSFKVTGPSDLNTGILLSSTSTDVPVVSFRVSDNSQRAKIEINGINGVNGDRLGFFVYLSSGNVNEKMSILGNGNVGIGFTAPAANLHVFGPTMIVGDSNTTQNVRQTIVGSTTGNASTTAKKIFVCGHTSTGTITVTAIITSVDTASATATFSFANAYGNSVTPNRLSYISLNSTITSIDCSYNNSGYQMEIAVTYTGATAPTLYFTAEGMGGGIWTL